MITDTALTPEENSNRQTKATKIPYNGFHYLAQNKENLGGKDKHPQSRFSIKNDLVNESLQFSPGNAKLS